MALPDYNKLDSMPSVAEAVDEPVAEAGGDLEPELKMLGKQLGFDAAKSKTLWRFVKACQESGYEEPAGDEDLEA